GGFLEEWTGVSGLTEREKVSDVVSDFGAVSRDLLDEARMFATELFLERAGTLEELLTSEVAFVTERTAGIYGLDPSLFDSSLQRTSVGNQGRSGVLSLPAVMASHSASDHVVPTSRGRWVLERLICSPLGNPPPVDGTQPAASPELSPRERLEVMQDFAGCAACHNIADPIGFAFDHFDVVGARVAESYGEPVDPSGEVRGTRATDGTFEDLRGLAETLLQSEEVGECVHLQFFEYVFGRTRTEADSCQLIASGRAWSQGDRSLKGLIFSVLDTQFARTRSAQQ
ncbi:MAG: DUF1588 domain-containing protein, partial [Myxococcota bacterium]